MLSEGFPEDILEITGQPAFEQLEQKFSGKLTIDKGKVRSSQGLLARDLFVIFYSQPIRKYFAGTEDYPGFDEHTVLQDLLHILENRRSELDRPLFLGIIPHPTQKAEDFKNYLGKGSLVIDPLQASNELMFSADLILGMTSSRLMEASIAGCQVLSLQPDCLRCFKFPETSNGSVQVLTSNEEMNEKNFELLQNKKEKVTKTVSKIASQHKDASKKITELIYDLLKKNAIKMNNAGKEV
jgi:predicted glycosyltransferase